MGKLLLMQFKLDETHSWVAGDPKNILSILCNSDCWPQSQVRVSNPAKASMALSHCSIWQCQMTAKEDNFSV